MNAASLAGRLSPGFFAHSLGVVNITVVSAICCIGLIFSMVAIGNGTSVVVIAVLYGYISGISKYQNFVCSFLFTRWSLRCNPRSASCRTFYIRHIWTGVSVTRLLMFTFNQSILFSARLGMAYAFCGPSNLSMSVKKNSWLANQGLEFWLVNPNLFGIP